MPAPTRFCTVADVRPIANVQAGFTDNDADIESAIRSVSLLIQNVTRREWHSDRRVEIHPVPTAPVRKTFRFWPKVRPISAAASVELRLMGEGGYVGEAIPATGYNVNYAEHRIDVFPGFITKGYAFLRLTYTAGLVPLLDDADVFDAPADIRRGCAMQSAFAFSRVINETLGVVQKAGKTGNTTFRVMQNGFIPEAHQLIAPHIRPLTGG